MTTDHIAEFAHMAALALADITDPTATVNAADEALASLEQSVTSLPLNHRHQGALISRTLYQMRIHNESSPCEALDVLRLMRTMLSYARGGSVCDLMMAGELRGYAVSVVTTMPVERMELRVLLRCVIGATERLAVELVVEKQHGGRRAAA